MNPARVLIIEDDPRDAELFRRLLESAGYQIEIATRPAAGLARARSGDFAAVLTDLNLGPERDEGRSLVIQLHAIDPHLPVILMTGGHTPDMAIEVIKLGAFDYFSKPLDPFDPNFCEELAEMVDHAVASKRLSAEVKLPDETAPGDQLTGDRIVGKSRAMQNVYKEIGRVATRPVTVLIRGETGTGKELVARAIYNHSDRPNQPFIVVNCAAIPEHLLESELFGHESGAFTGAKSSRLGRFELAHGGTVFLDEIGDMNLKLQQKLLRVLQEGTIERLGGKAPIAVDARVIAATHRDLETAVQEGEFRQDLYFRLNVAMISLPALRERKEDLFDLITRDSKTGSEVRVPGLVNYFVQRYGAELGSIIPRVTEEALRKLEGYDWPGNVRELRNVIRKALLLARGYPITAEIIGKALDQTKPPRPTKEEPFATHVANVLESAKNGERENVMQDLMEVVERELYFQALRRAGGDHGLAKRWLGVSKPTLLERLARYSLLPGQQEATPKPATAD